MGGVPPLGYRAQDSKLLVIESEAKIVCAIFRRYAELGSVRLLKDELEARGIKSKSWTTASGRRVGGKPFSRGALYLMLQNRLYRGEIVHKGQSHPGEHTPIIDQLLWDAVQAQLAANTAERNSGAGIVKLTVSREKNIKRSRRSHCSDRVVPLVGRLGSEDPQRGA